jgi:hypothetical protein
MFCFVSSLSYAQDVQKQGACKADYEKFCKDVKPGQGRIAQCMKQHEAEYRLPVRSSLRQKEKRHGILSKPANRMRKNFVKVLRREREEFIAV